MGRARRALLLAGHGVHVLWDRRGLFAHAVLAALYRPLRGLVQG